MSTDRILWNQSLIDKKLVELHTNISNLKMLSCDLEKITFESSNKASANSVLAFKVSMKKHIDSRIAYMEALMNVMAEKGEEFKLVDENSLEHMDIRGGYETCV